jgi:hypothetical protein
VPIGRITGRVWLDRNGNGQQDASEPGVAGIPLALAPQVVASGEASDIVLTTTTDAAGRFEFSALPFGRYVLAILDLPNLLPTTHRKLTVDILSESPSFDATFGVRTYEQERLYLPFLLR